MSYTVYVHKNKHNGKVYVGITSREPAKRWDKGRGYISNKPFYNAIKRYGWESGFEHDVIAEGLTSDQAEEFERMLIRYYESNNPEFGYNMTEGGFGYSGAKQGTRRLNKLPEYRNILANNFKRALFRELLSVAFGGRELKETTELFDEQGNCVKRTVRTHRTEPNIEVIEALISNYESEPLLSKEIVALKGICASLNIKEKEDV